MLTNLFLFLVPVLDEAEFDPEYRSTLLFIGNVSKRNEHGEIKIKAAKDLLDRICGAIEKAIEIPVKAKFALISSSCIVRFGRTNG